MRTSPIRFLTCLLAAAVLGGCASSHGTKGAWPYPDEPRAPSSSPQQEQQSPGVPSPIPAQQPDKPLASYPKSADDISNAAVLSLLNQAREQRSAGNFDQAAAALERAVRIEPRNYFVWAALAQVHLDQHSFDEAETVAQRSNSLAHGNLYVEVENWKTIAAARNGRGDAGGAQDAQAKVDEMQRTLAGG
jgi:tetratricopeptide (TPR) repeat protein